MFNGGSAWYMLPLTLGGNQSVADNGAFQEQVYNCRVEIYVSQPGVTFEAAFVPVATLAPPA
ncbi:MAG: hypothetical protein LBV77_01150 [Candidatus Adiutrix intracellularis]|nr:hypothetical protein [Candidatus Adiutrix intracellularis]